jgi:methyl-accepting chemotaxis protein
MRTLAAALTSFSGFPAFPIRLAVPHRLLSSLSIRVRLGALAGLAIVAALAIGVTGRIALSQMDQSLARQDVFRRLNDQAGDIRARAASARIHQEAFLREMEPADAESFRRDIGLIVQALAAMRTGQEVEGMTRPLADLERGFVTVGESFAKVEALMSTMGLSASSGLRGRLAASAKAVEQELQMWPNAGPLMPAMLHMRLAERTFMLFGDAGSKGRHRKYANEFDFALDASALPKSTQDDLRTLMNAYAADMQAYADTWLALKAEVDGLRTVFAAQQPLLQTVFLTARDGMTAAIAQQERQRSKAALLAAGIGVAAIVIFLCAVLVLSHSVTQPLRRIEQAMGRLAAGDHDVVVPGIDRQDEIGDMAQAVQVFKDNAIQMVRLQRDQEIMRREAETANRGRMQVLADHFEGAVKTVADGVGDRAQSIRDIALRMTSRGGEQGTGTLEVAEAARRARSSVAAVSQASRDLRDSVRSIRYEAGESANAVRQAVAELEGANVRVRGLAGLAGDIDRVVGLIGDIAQRTNMLALNASIEAQRAGAAGKSFAVVAGEVKQLANQTAEATREIETRLSAIQSATGETVNSIAGVGETVTRLDAIAGRVAAAAHRQAEVTGNIERCVAEVETDTSIVTEGVMSVTQTAARYCGSAVRVIWAADDLAGPATALRGQVDQFLDSVRAG